MKKIIAYTVLMVSLTFTAVAQERPNFLWITCEDISPFLAGYGDSTVVTPNIDRLMNEGVVYDNMFATVGVCAPARSSIITGMYPVSIGTHNMRTGKDIRAFGKRKYEKEIGVKDREGNNVPQYSAVIPPYVKCFTEYLRAEGYFCTNNSKTDYQFAAPLTAWDENSKQAHWRNRPSDKPFFSVFNLGISHESQLWIGWKNGKKELHTEISEVTVPPYLYDNDSIRTDLARNYTNIQLLDMQVEELLGQLKEDGLLKNTYIFFFSDHGGPLPRGKRQIYDTGLKVPFVVRFPGKDYALQRDSALHSFVDLAPTVLSLASIPIPDHMQGQAFLGEQKVPKQRRFIYGTKDRMDECNEMVRAIRSSKYLYIRNYLPEQAAYLDIAYRKQLISMREMLRLNQKDQLNQQQKQWFQPNRPKEELYDVEKDPFQLFNLAEQEQYQDILISMRKELKNWQTKVDDKGFISEAELVNSMWPDFEQPKTSAPQFNIENGQVTLSCTTEGASIAYQISSSKQASTYSRDWKLYTQPFKLTKGILHVRAVRIGYKDSNELIVQNGKSNYVISSDIQ